MANGGRKETHLGNDGLWIPPGLREFTSQVVFRTPRATIQHFQRGGGELEAYYGLIDESHFGDPSEMRDPKNPDLAPNHVVIKAQGEEPVKLVVNTEPNSELVADGGREVSDDGLVLEFPDLEEKFGETIVNTAAHVLDRDLLKNGKVQDDLIPARIRGIDTPEELAAYRAVETRTRNRDRVHKFLSDRADWLKANGFRPEDLTAALLDQDVDLPERYRLRVPLWVSTYDLRELPEIEFEKPTASSPTSSATTSASSTSMTTQVTLAPDGGDSR